MNRDNINLVSDFLRFSANKHGFASLVSHEPKNSRLNIKSIQSAYASAADLPAYVSELRSVFSDALKLGKDDFASDEISLYLMLDEDTLDQQPKKIVAALLRNHELPSFMNYLLGI